MNFEKPEKSDLIMIICYTVPEIYGVWWMSLLFFNVGYFLLFYPPNSPKKENLKKKKKKETTTTTWRYHHFTQVYQKSWSYAMLFLRYMVRDGCNCYTWRYHFTHVYQKLWLDDVRYLIYGARRTDGRKKWHIEDGALPKKINISNRVQLSLGWQRKAFQTKFSYPNFDI